MLTPKISKIEIRRFYGVYEVYVDDVLIQSFCALWAAKEFVTKLGE